MATGQEKEIKEGGITAYLDKYMQKELLSLLTCGSVDDGKSTLIGRLLHDSQIVFEDQLAAVVRDSVRHGTTGDQVDLALLVDGLQAEREQGITIDVAYRYFATAARKFIIADTPGHEQYTRNMATGASNCDLAVILIDARNGVLDQTRRHAFIVSLLGIKHLVVAVNKMDLVEYSEDVFKQIVADFTSFAAKLQVSDIHFIPVSALVGDNVVNRSTNMPWFHGGPVLDYLETVHIASDRNLIDLRFPVQAVLRPNLNFRGYAGTIASGVMRRGDEVMVLPSGRKSRVKSIVTYDGELAEAFPPMAVTITLADEIDASRGDIFCQVNNAPHLDHAFEAMVVWMSETPLKAGQDFLLKHGTLQTPAVVTDVRYRVNINTHHREEVVGLGLNEIGRLRLETSRPIAFDPYTKNRHNGAFILIDRLRNGTLAAGMILDRIPGEVALQPPQASADAGTNVRVRRSTVSMEKRAKRLGQAPFTVWLAGLPRSGKSSIAYALEEEMFRLGKLATVLDGENLRLGLCRDLGFSGQDRAENLRRAAEIARLFNQQGIITIASFISPLAADREQARRIISPERFVQVFCDTPLAVCEERDTEGLYARARAGEIQNVTGVDAPFEVPESADVVLPTAVDDVATNVQKVIATLQALKLL